MAVLTPDRPAAERIRAANGTHPWRGMTGAVHVITALSDPRACERAEADAIIQAVERGGTRLRLKPVDGPNKSGHDD